MRVWLLLFFFAFQSLAQEDCPAEKIPAKYKEVISYFKSSQKLILGEPLPTKKLQPREEFLYRARTKNWTGYNWPLLANDWTALFKGEEYYLVHCHQQSPLLIEELVKDFNTQKIPQEQEGAFFRSLLLYWPCADAFTNRQMRNIINKQFSAKTEQILTLLIHTESEMGLLTDHYKACGAKKRKFLLMDTFLNTQAEEIKKISLDKYVSLRLKNYRSSESRFESAQYFFKRLDEILAQ